MKKLITSSEDLKLTGGLELSPCPIKNILKIEK
jgi:hypothetical protein